MTTGGGAGGQAGVLYIDVEVRTDGVDTQVEALEQDLEQAGGEAGEAGGEAAGRGFSEKFKAGLVVATGAALAFAGVLVGVGKSAFDMASTAAQNVRELEAKLGVTTQEAERLGDVAVKVFGNNWGANLEEAAAAVGNVRKQLGNLTDEELQKVTEGTIAISETFEEEQDRVAQAVQSVMKATGASSQEALDFITKGFQKGLNSSGDFLDTLMEYGPQFEKGKLGAGELFSLLETGASKGALGTDKVADAFKEFGLTVVEVSEDSSSVYKELGLSHEKIVQQINSGQMTTGQAFQLVTEKLKGVQGEANRTRIAAAIFGGAGEDMATLMQGLDMTKTKLGDLSGATDGLNVRYNNFGQFVEGVWRKIQVALLPVGKELLSMANEAMPYLQKAADWLGSKLPGWLKGGADAVRAFGSGAVQAYNTVRPAIDAVAKGADALGGFLKRNQEIIIPLAAGVTAAAAAFGVYRGTIAAVTVAKAAWTVATTAATTASVALRAALTFITGPVGIVITVIGLLVAAGVALYRNWDEVKAWALKTWSSVKDTIMNLLGAAVDFVKGLPERFRQAGVDLVLGLARGITNARQFVVDKIIEIASGALGAIKKFFGIKSPSTVMAEQGAFIGAGLALGIEKSKPEVQAAAAGLALGAKSAFDGAKASVVASAEDLARTVADTTKGGVSQARADLEKAIATDAWVASLERLTVAQLKQQQAQARSKGDADKYNALTSELSRREAEHTAEVEKNREAVKARADELANNRAQLEAGLSFEKFTASLRGATSARLEQLAAEARAAGDSQKFNAVRGEITRREDAHTAAVEKSAQAERDRAEARRQAIEGLERGLKFDAWVAGLKGLDDAQLKSGLAAARASGDQERYNALLGEQKRRVEEANAAWGAYIDQQVKVGQSVQDAISRTGGTGVAGGATNFAYSGPMLSAADLQPQIDALKSVDAVETFRATLVKLSREGALLPGVFAEVNAALDAQASQVIAVDTATQGVYDTWQFAREESKRFKLSLDELRPLIPQMAADWDTWKVALEQMAAAGTITYATLQTLTQAARQARDAEAAYSAAVMARANAKPPEEVTPEKARPRRTAPGVETGPTRTPPREEDVFRNMAPLPVEDAPEAARGTGLSDEALKRLRDFEALMKRLAFDEWKGGLKGMTDEQLRLALETARTSKNVDQYSAVLGEQTRRTDEAAAKSKAWSDNLSNLEFGKWKEGLKGLTDEQLAQQLVAAQSAQNVGQYNALLEEQGRRSDTAAAKTKAWGDNLASLDFNGWKEGLKGLSDEQLAQELASAKAAENVTRYNAVLDEQKRRTDEAAAKVKAWADNVERLAFDKWKADLAALTDAQLRQALATAEANKDVERYNAILSEMAGRAKTAADAQKPLADRINEWGRYAQEILPVVTAGMQAVGGASSDLASQWGSDLGSMISDITKFGVQLASGDFLGAAITALQTIFNWINRNAEAARKEAAAAAQYNNQFKFSDTGYGTREVSTYTTGFLFWETTHYVERVDEVGKALALALENGFANGMATGFQNAINTGDFSNFEKDLKTSVGKAVLDGLIDAFMNEAIMKDTLGPRIQAYLDARKSGDASKIAEARQGLLDGIKQGKELASDFFENVLKPVAQDFGLYGNAAPAKPAPGSLADLEEQRRVLQQQQAQVTSAAEYQRIQAQIDAIDGQIDAIKGQQTAGSGTSTTPPSTSTPASGAAPATPAAPAAPPTPAAPPAAPTLVVPEAVWTPLTSASTLMHTTYTAAMPVLAQVARDLANASLGRQLDRVSESLDDLNGRIDGLPRNAEINVHVDGERRAVLPAEDPYLNGYG